MEERLAQIEAMLESNPNDSFLIYAAGLEYSKRGMDSKAIELLKKVLEVDPAYLAAYFQLGQLLERTGNPEPAADVYSKGIAVADEQGEAKTKAELTEALAIL